MSIKNINRIINQCYVQRSIEYKEFQEESTITLIEFVYDLIWNKYGILKIAEKKFLALMNGCKQAKDNNQSIRVRLFGRFLGLYSELQIQDLKLYLDVVDQAYKLVLNFQIQEQDELPLIPSLRATEIFKAIFSSRLSQTSLQKEIRKLVKLYKRLEGPQKVLHLKSAQDAIPLDLLAQFIIDLTNKLHKEKRQNIQDIF